MNSKRIFLILTIVGALAFGVPGLNFYPQLSQGDHGRDLYAAQEVLRGKLPYKDFWWVYGPLMPYYYAFFYKIAGGHIGSFLLGKMLVKTAAAAFFYLAAATAMAPSVAFLAAMWFVQSQQEFFFTFNHIGGIAMEMMVIFLLFAYIQNQRPRALRLVVPAIFVYMLIKINFGLTALAAAALTVALADWVRKTPWTVDKKRFYLALAVLPLAAGFVYWLLVHNLPLYVIRQCHPYFGDDQPHHFSPLVTIPYYFTQH